jgi:small subunit ribosomal protein S20
MPNTKSAERRVRSNARKQTRNSAIKSRVTTLEKKYLDLTKAGSKDAAGSAFRALTSVLDKAVKTGVLKRGTVDRKKSRHAVRLTKVAAPAA